MLRFTRTALQGTVGRLKADWLLRYVTQWPRCWTLIGSYVTSLSGHAVESWLAVTLCHSVAVECWLAVITRMSRWSSNISISSHCRHKWAFSCGGGSRSRRLERPLLILRRLSRWTVFKCQSVLLRNHVNSVVNKLPKFFKSYLENNFTWCVFSQFIRYQHS